MKSIFVHLAAAAALAIAACKPTTLTLNQENLDKVQEGMSAAQVKAILGEPTASKSEPIPIVGGTKTTYTYAADGNEATVVLKNDTVQAKEGHFVNR